MPKKLALADRSEIDGRVQRRRRNEPLDEFDDTCTQVQPYEILEIVFSEIDELVRFTLFVIKLF